MQLLRFVLLVAFCITLSFAYKSNSLCTVCRALLDVGRISMVSEQTLHTGTTTLENLIAACNLPVLQPFQRECRAIVASKGDYLIASVARGATDDVCREINLCPTDSTECIACEAVCEVILSVGCDAISSLCGPFEAACELLCEGACKVEDCAEWACQEIGFCSNSSSSSSTTSSNAASTGASSASSGGSTGSSASSGGSTGSSASSGGSTGSSASSGGSTGSSASSGGSTGSSASSGGPTSTSSGSATGSSGGHYARRNHHY